MSFGRFHTLAPSNQAGRAPLASETPVRESLRQARFSGAYARGARDAARDFERVKASYLGDAGRKVERRADR